MLTPRLTTFALLLAAPLSMSSAQSYTRGANDTLRFHELTSGEMTLSAPQGELSVSTRHDATVGVLLLPGDSARAWYETLQITANSPMGATSPETKELIGKPFRLGFDARGRVSMLESPPLPSSLAGVSDLSHQFDDFFPRLPAAPLRLGLAWSDTVVRADSTADKTTRTRTIGSFRVERDTTVAGMPAFVISSRQTLHSDSEGSVPGQPVRAKVVLDGNDEGYFVFAARSGRYLGRQRTGNLKGEVTMNGDGNSMVMMQAFKFTNQVDVVRK